MMKIFISQPMRGKTDEEILSERNRAINKIKETVYEEDVEIVDSFLKDIKVPNGANESLYYLGNSLTLLSTANIAYFIKGWNEARGCKIEHECAVKYGLKVIEE